MICANKHATAYRPKEEVPEEANGKAYGVWSASFNRGRM